MWIPFVPKITSLNYFQLEKHSRYYDMLMLGKQETLCTVQVVNVMSLHPSHCNNQATVAFRRGHLCVCAERGNLRVMFLAQELDTNDFFVQLAQLGTQCTLTSTTTITSFLYASPQGQNFSYIYDTYTANTIFLCQRLSNILYSQKMSLGLNFGLGSSNTRTK